VIKRWKPAAMTTSIALALTGCSTGHVQRAGMEETITQDEAATKIQEHIDGVISSLPRRSRTRNTTGHELRSL
jgi:hypothetical protein